MEVTPFFQCQEKVCDVTTRVFGSLEESSEKCFLYRFATRKLIKKLMVE